jgi:superfamily II DNA/RNA helicase
MRRLHRSGRTARAGAEGAVVTLVLPEQKRDVSQLLRKAAISVEPVAVTASSPEVVQLVGQVAPYVKPVPVAETPRGTSQGANAQRKRAAREGRETDAAAGARSGGSGSAGGRRRGSSQGAAQGAGRQPAAGGQRRDAATARDKASHQRHDQSAGHARSAQPAGNPRTPGRRASTAGKLMVGSVVRPNGTSRRGGR